jgi:hypothetical protein
MSTRLDVAPALEERGIVLKRYQPGEHRAPCPECDRGPRDDALAVRVDHDGATWICHRCDWRGGIGPGREERPARRAPPRQDARPEPGRYETLAPHGLRLWERTRPIVPGTVAAAYLEHRGCALPPYPDETHLRWHGALKHPSGHVGPGLVGLVTTVLDCEPISLHRTWLKPDGAGKADLNGHKPRKLLWNHRSDGVVRLWPDEDVTLGLVIGEGIETCLAAARAGYAPAWATMSAHNLAAFPVLPGLEGLTVLVDHDKPDKRGRRAGIDAARELIARYVAAGFDPERDLRVIMSPSEGEDAADLGNRHGDL